MLSGAVKESNSHLVSSVSDLFLPIEVATALRLHAESVRRAIREKRIKAIKTGRHWKISADELARLKREGL